MYTNEQLARFNKGCKLWVKVIGKKLSPIVVAFNVIETGESVKKQIAEAVTDKSDKDMVDELAEVVYFIYPKLRP